MIVFKFINFKKTYYGNEVYVKNTFLPIDGYKNVLIRPIKKRFVKIN